MEKQHPKGGLSTPKPREQPLRATAGSGGGDGRTGRLGLEAGDLQVFWRLKGLRALVILPTGGKP